MNICANCKHFKSHGPEWYDHYCRAPQNERIPVINPVTGAHQYNERNDLGGTFYTDQKYPHARDCNPLGECSLYEEYTNLFSRLFK